MKVLVECVVCSGLGWAICVPTCLILSRNPALMAFGISVAFVMLAGFGYIIFGRK